MLGLRNKIYDLLRRKVINMTTHNIGRCENAYGTEIMYCYINWEKIKDKFNCGDKYSIMLYYYPDKDLDEVYKIDKDIIYIFDGITFDKPIEVDIYSNYFNGVTFRNCTFTKEVNINHTDSVVFNNNSYTSGLHIYENFNLKISKEVRYSKFINEYTATYMHNTICLMSCSKKLEIIDSYITGDIIPIINCDNLVIKNSNIGLKNGNVTADNIEQVNSRISSRGLLNINNRNYNSLNNLNCRYLTYNGVMLYDSAHINKKSFELQRQRRLLTDKLKEILVNSQMTIINEIDRYKDEYKKQLDREISKHKTSLESTPVSRVLKRK